MESPPISVVSPISLDDGKEAEKIVKVEDSQGNTSAAVTVEPMLQASRNHFKKILPNPFGRSETTFYGLYVNKPTRSNLDVDGVTCFEIRDLVTSKECNYYIKEAEKAGFDSINDLFEEEYRKNDRILSLSEEIADDLWKRIEQHMTREDIIHIHPIGFGNAGTWKPYRLNECIKFGRYQKGGHFSPHIDGPWIPQLDDCSVFTVVIYLNDDFEGGHTRFLKKSTKPHDTALQTLHSVKPVKGKALIFAHDTLHDSTAITKGTKYVMRTEIIFQRVDSDLLSEKVRNSYLQSPKFHEMSKLYAAHRDKKGKEFVDTYMQALELQLEASKCNCDGDYQVDILILPQAIWLKCLVYLNAEELVPVIYVSKVWYENCTDGLLWRALYLRKWPELVNLENHYINGTLKTTMKIDPYLKDWYRCYKQRVHIQQNFCAVTIDTGSHSLKYGSNNDAEMDEIRSVTNCTRVRISHTRSGTRFIIGEQAVAAPGHYRRNPENRAVINGIPAIKHCRLLWQGPFRRNNGSEGHNYSIQEVSVSGHRGSITPYLTPVVMVEPSFGWRQSTKKLVRQIFFDQLRVPALIFIKSPRLVSLHYECHTGIVIEFGDSVLAVSVIYRDFMITSKTIDFKREVSYEMAFFETICVQIGQTVGSLLSTSMISKILRTLQMSELDSSDEKEMNTTDATGSTTYHEITRQQKLELLWKFEDFNSKWRLMPEDTSVKLTEMFERGIKTYDLLLNGTIYTFDFVDLWQVNTATSTSRRIMPPGDVEFAIWSRKKRNGTPFNSKSIVRIPFAERSNTPHLALWKYQDGARWLLMSSSTSALLTQMIERGLTTGNLPVGGTMYHYDFTLMEQTNTQSKVSRHIIPPKDDELRSRDTRQQHASRWKFHEGTRWPHMSSTASALLTQMVEAGATTGSLAINGTIYHYDFTLMEQTNRQTKMSRHIIPPKNITVNTQPTSSSQDVQLQHNAQTGEMDDTQTNRKEGVQNNVDDSLSNAEDAQSNAKDAQNNAKDAQNNVEDAKNNAEDAKLESEDAPPLEPPSEKEIRGSLLQNIILTGGNTMLAAFKDTIQSVFKEQFDEFAILDPPRGNISRIYSAVLGGQALSSLSHFSKLHQLESRDNRIRDSFECSSCKNDGILLPSCCLKCGADLCKACSGDEKLVYCPKNCHIGQVPLRVDGYEF